MRWLYRAPRSQYSHKTIFLPDLVRADVRAHRAPQLHGLTFEDCVIEGPAILALLNNTRLEHCTFDANGVDSLLLPIEPPRWVVGVIACHGVTFRRCQMVAIGAVATPEDIERLWRPGFDQTPLPGEPPWFNRING